MASREFSGTAQYIDLGTPTALNNFTICTYCAWIYPDTISTIACILDRFNGTSDTGSTGKNFRIEGDGSSNGKLTFIVSGSGSNARAMSVANFCTTNEWQFVAGTFAGGAVAPKVWRATLGNVPVEPSYGTSAALGGSVENDATITLNIGRHAAGASRLWDGKIARVMMWDVALTVEELTTVMYGGLIARHPKLLKPLGQSSPEVDWSGNGISGTVTGATVADGPPVPWLFGRPRYLSFAAAGGGPINLVVADATHAHTTDGIALVQANILALADTAHSHVTDGIALTQANTLALADTVHAHTTDGIALAQAHVLALADTLHAHTTDGIALTQANTLALADALHSHTTDGITLVQANILAVQDTVHAHTTDGIVLSTAINLVVADTLHSHLADNIALLQANVLSVSDALHGHTTDGITLTQAHVLAIQDALHGHLADAILLDVGGITLSVADTLHAHTTDGIALTQANVLVVSDALHAHLADVIALAGSDFYLGRVYISVVSDSIYLN
jgi:hypothetical protein